MFENYDVSGIRAALEKSPSSGASRKGLSLTEMQAAVAPAIIGHCLEGRPFSVRELWQATPEIRDVQVTANALGTALGRGFNGKGGLLLVSDRRRFLPVFENAMVAIVALRNRKTSVDCCALFGLSEQELQSRVTQLECTTPEGEALCSQLRSSESQS